MMANARRYWIMLSPLYAPPGSAGRVVCAVWWAVPPGDKQMKTYLSRPGKR